MEVSTNPTTPDIINESHDEMKARHMEAIKKYLGYILNIRVTGRVGGHLVYHSEKLYNLSLFMFERDEVEQAVEDVINNVLASDSDEYKQELKVFIVDELYTDVIFHFDDRGIQHSKQFVELLLKGKADAQHVESEWYSMLEYIITFGYKRAKFTPEGKELSPEVVRDPSSMETIHAVCKHLEENPSIVKHHGMELIECLEGIKETTGDYDYVSPPMLTINKIASRIQPSA